MKNTYALQLDNGWNGSNAPRGSAEEICPRFPSVMGNKCRLSMGRVRLLEGRGHMNKCVRFPAPNPIGESEKGVRILVNSLYSLSNVNDQSSWAIGWCKSVFNDFFYVTAVLVAAMPANEYIR